MSRRHSFGFSDNPKSKPLKTHTTNYDHQNTQARQADALIAQGRIIEAEKICTHLINSRTNNHSVYTNLAIIRGIQGDHNSAKSLLNKAILLNAKAAEPYYNLGITHEQLGDLESAIQAYKKALEINAKDTECIINLGNILAATGKISGAFEAYKKALEIIPNNPELRWNHSLAMLLSGDYKNGWEEYEWRHRRPRSATEPHAYPKCKRWKGEELKNSTKLIFVSEQGLGDTLQFMRYADAFQKQGFDISICAQPKLHGLIKASGIARAPLSPLEASQVKEGCWLPLLSAPKHLGVHPQNPVIDAPYIKTSKELLAKWKSILAIESKPIIGINWQGNPNSEKTGLKGRSLPLKAFSKIALKKDISLLSLQKGFGSEQLKKCSFKESFIKSQCLINETWDFLETAAIIANCDLIITSDTAVAHLAGGLGKPTWLLLHKVPDWRWGLEGDTTFWYPSMRLFRQRNHGDWNEVMERVNTSLKAYFKVP